MTCVLNKCRTCSHLSNKRGDSLIDFEKKIHPLRKNSPSSFIDFLDFFSNLLIYSNFHVYIFLIQMNSRFKRSGPFWLFTLLVYWIYKKIQPPRLFPPPRLLILQLVHPPRLLERWEYRNVSDDISDISKCRNKKIKVKILTTFIFFVIFTKIMNCFYVAETKPGKSNASIRVRFVNYNCKLSNIFDEIDASFH